MRATKPPRPLARRPLTRQQASRLEWDAWCAVNRWRGRYSNGRLRSCRLCGAPSPRYEGLCRWCHTVPLDTAEAAQTLAEWADLEAALQRRASVDELVIWMAGGAE